MHATGTVTGGVQVFTRGGHSRLVGACSYATETAPGPFTVLRRPSVFSRTRRCSVRWAKNKWAPPVLFGKGDVHGASQRGRESIVTGRDTPARGPFLGKTSQKVPSSDMKQWWLLPAGRPCASIHTHCRGASFVCLRSREEKPTLTPPQFARQGISPHGEGTTGTLLVAQRVQSRATSSALTCLQMGGSHGRSERVRSSTTSQRYIAVSKIIKGVMPKTFCGPEVWVGSNVRAELGMIGINYAAGD